MEDSARAYTVSAETCPHDASDEEVFERLSETTASLTRSWDRLARAGKIAIKFNQDFPYSSQYAGQRRELVSDSVVRAVLRLLRERTDAELVCVDASYMKLYNGSTPTETTQIRAALDEYGVGYIDCTEPPFCECEAPGGGAMFDRYHFNEGLIGADELVSVAKMKNHAFMGVTGTLKNLFGLMPGAFRPRHYYHHLVRMPYMLADIGRILSPVLNIVDGLVAQAGREWRDTDEGARVKNTLIAGDHPVATDSCMATIMGHNPADDWLTDPFLRDRNSLRVASEYRFGTNNINLIDFDSDVSIADPGEFFCLNPDPIQTVIDWRRSMCEQALYYRDHRAEFESYSNQFIMLQRGEVKWQSPSGYINVSRRTLAGNRRKESLFLKFVDPEEREAEHFEVYERALQDIEEKGI